MIDFRLLSHKFLIALILNFVLASNPVPICLAKERIPDGIYLIEKRVEKNISKSNNSLFVLKNDPKFLKQKDGTIFFALLKNPFVPISLQSKADKGIDDKGRPKLLLSLETEQVKPLERLTGQNIGKDIAIVIDGKVVSAHQIKQTIKDGRFQITRCHDNGCEALYIELSKKKSL